MKRLFRFPTRARSDIRDDIRDEFAFHLETRIDELVRAGMTADAARAQARREFGNATDALRGCESDSRIVERRRGVRRLAGELWQDLRYGVRLILRNKGFAAAAVLTLAVAIGGNTTMFGIVNTLFLQPLAIRAPGEIVRIYPGQSSVSWPNADDIARQNVVFSNVILQRHAFVTMRAEPLPLRLTAGLVGMDYFSVLGVPPLAGRTLQADDRRTDVVVLSERLWRRQFAADPSLIGRRLVIENQPREVIGIMPVSFRGIVPPGLAHQLWLPLDPDGAHRGWVGDRATPRFELYGRLKPGGRIEEAAAAMRVVGARMAEEHPATNATFARMVVFRASGVGLYRGFGNALMPVFAFLGFMTIVAGFLLAISCANVAGLLIGRAAARKQEIAVRLAIGAGRGRLVRQLLAESLVLALLGGAGGLVTAAGLALLIPRLTARLPFPIDLDFTIDLRVLGYALALSVVTALLFGLAPARRASRPDLMTALRVDGESLGARQRFRQALVVAQVAVSALLLFWSGLFVRSLLQSNSVDPGFYPDGVLLTEIEPRDDVADGPKRLQADLVELHARIGRLPGVEAVGASSIVPLSLLGNERFRVAPWDAPTDTPATWVVASRLTPGWFDAVRIPIVAGRDFTWTDREGAPRVVLVNETLARQFWNGAAIGRDLKYGTSRVQVVGVVRDSKYWTLGEPISPTVYLPYQQVLPSYAMVLHVRTSDFRGTAEQIRHAIHAISPGTTFHVRPMRDAVAVAIVPAQVGAITTGAFGALGALLATLGVYGLIAFIVAQRTRELAIRLAIGASAAHIARVVVGSTLTLAAIGLACGIAAGALTAPILGGLLVNVSPLDPPTMLGTIVVVLAAAVAASALPAARAMRVDPLAALKAE